MNDKQTKRIHILATIDRISADAQLLLTEATEPDNSVARVRQMAIGIKTKIQEALDQLNAREIILIKKCPPVLVGTDRDTGMDGHVLAL